MAEINTCRFCGKGSHEDCRPFVKYGVRHYACQPCYLDHKSVDDLKNWQVGSLSYRLLQERGLLETVRCRLSKVEAA